MQEQPNAKKLCECGCGESVKPGKRFRHGHNQRGAEFSEEHRRRIGDALRRPKIPVPCECGCGELANPGRRFIAGHGMRGRTLGPEWSQKIGDANRGERNGHWKGDEAGYLLAHHRVRRLRGKADEYACEMCGKRAYDWALNYNCSSIRLEDDKSFSLDPDAYHSLCRSCHIKADRGGGFRA